jgi:hypothetical protein
MRFLALLPSLPEMRACLSSGRRMKTPAFAFLSRSSACAGRGGGGSGSETITLRAPRIAALVWPGLSACIVRSWYEAQTDLTDAWEHGSVEAWKGCGSITEGVWAIGDQFVVTSSPCDDSRARWRLMSSKPRLFARAPPIWPCGFRYTSVDLVATVLYCVR